jgi:methyltransferase-like protein/protein-L-isoaspartate O-methyltransferase
LADYDEFLYDDHPFVETHPDNLSALGRLFALSPAPPSQCRVLELGCALGGNLIPMAAAMPESSFVGVDLSPRQIDVGLKEIAALGLTNIQLFAKDILEVDASLGTFDYILCHGVYSWVPPEVQAKILRVCREQLRPEGIAYISYNTLPGWHMRGMVRDLLLREVDPSGLPEERIARGRAFLSFLDHLPSRGSPAQAWLKSEIKLLGQLSDQYLLYEHMVEHNRPQYFRDFARDAAQSGLQYLADAHFTTMVPDRFGGEAAAMIDDMASTIIDTEQYLDYLELRFFRRTLLCHQERRVDRGIDWQRLAGLWVSSSLTPASDTPDLRSDARESFRSGSSTELTTGLPILKAAMVLLASAGHRGLSFEELCARARALLDEAEPTDPTPADGELLGSNLLGIFARGYVELGGWEKPYASVAGPRPTATPLARRQAALGKASCTNVAHVRVQTDSFERSLLARMDGTHDLEALVTFVIEDIAAGKVRVEVDGEPRSDRETILDIAQKKLVQLGRAALLIA